MLHLQENALPGTLFVRSGFGFLFLFNTGGGKNNINALKEDLTNNSVFLLSREVPILVPLRRRHSLLCLLLRTAGTRPASAGSRSCHLKLNPTIIDGRGTSKDISNEILKNK